MPSVGTKKLDIIGRAVTFTVVQRSFFVFELELQFMWVNIHHEEEEGL